MLSPSTRSEGNEPIEKQTKQDHLSSSPKLVENGLIRRLSVSLPFAPKIQPLGNLPDLKTSTVLNPVPRQNGGDVLAVRSFRKPINNTKLNESSIVTINVSGDRFQTRLSTLQLYPDTLLGNEEKRKTYWDSTSNEYFFDRHRACFEAILYYYQSHGRLRRPDFVPLDTFLEEISFFELGSDAINQIHKDENVKKVEDVLLPRTIWRRYIWFYMEFPEHSHLGRIISVVSVVFTLLSCVALAVESLPTYTNRWDGFCINITNLSMNVTDVPPCLSPFSSPFFIIQTICVSFFTIEFFLRLISTPSYRKFFLSILTWVDIGTVIPYFVFLIIQSTDPKYSVESGALLGIRLLRVLRFTRILRVSRICRQLKTLRVLSATLKESLIDFAAMITILALLAFIFGAATYFAEKEANDGVFDSIPVSLYWGVITITGVGYGDMFPISVAGRIITCFCALFGPVTMGMLVSVIVDRYQRVYNRKMYITEPDISPVDLDGLSLTESRRSIFTSQKLFRKKETSSSIQSNMMKMKSHSNPSLSTKTTDLQRFQFQVDIHRDDDDEFAVDRVVTAMKRKLTEAVTNTDVEVNLKLIDSQNKELWTTTSSPNSTALIAPVITITLQNDDDDAEEYQRNISVEEI